MPVCLRRVMKTSFHFVTLINGCGPLAYAVLGSLPLRLIQLPDIVIPSCSPLRLNSTPKAFPEKRIQMKGGKTEMRISLRAVMAALVTSQRDMASKLF